MEEGWVYVLVNSCMQGVAKVGRTTRLPRDRAAELSAVTGVATPYVVAYEQSFADCHAAERAIHALLDRTGLRVNPAREFFWGTAPDIIALFRQAGAALEAGAPAPDAQEAAARTADDLLAAGDDALYGHGDVLQDTGEAVRLYRQAAAKGALDAHARLGSIYVQLYAVRQNRAGRRRALAPLKEGARRGDPYCYCEMAELFALEGHMANMAKAWSLFFAASPDRTAPRFVQACCRYVAMCLHTRQAPACLEALQPVAASVLSALLAELDRVRADPAARRLVAASLRWVYANLLAEPAALPKPARRAWRLPAAAQFGRPMTLA